MLSMKAQELVKRITDPSAELPSPSHEYFRGPSKSKHAIDVDLTCVVEATDGKARVADDEQ